MQTVQTLIVRRLIWVCTVCVSFLFDIFSNCFSASVKMCISWVTSLYYLFIITKLAWCAIRFIYFNLTYQSEIPPRKHGQRWPLVYGYAGLGGSVGCAVRLETRRSRVQPPPRSATFFRGDWSWNIFYGHSLPSADSRRAVVSFWRKNVHSTG